MPKIVSKRAFESCNILQQNMRQIVTNAQGCRVQYTRKIFRTYNQ